MEGKLFFALKAKRLLTFALANNYIETPIQKGGIPEVSGCLEHTALLSQLIREAKTGKGDLVVAWLDIATAYGSIPHSLILTALERTRVPERMCQMIKSYYSDIQICFTTREYTTDWLKVEKGIITDCITVSPSHCVPVSLCPRSLCPRLIVYPFIVSPSQCVLVSLCPRLIVSPSHYVPVSE